MKKSNSALYEQIMRNVSKEVKRALNESLVNEQTQYVAGPIMLTATEDSWEEGQNPDNSSEWEEYTKFRADSIKDLVKKVGDYYGCGLDSTVIYDDYVLMDAIVDEHNIVLNPAEIEEWKKGVIKAYSLEVRFNILKQTTILHDELVANGFESYD